MSDRIERKLDSLLGSRRVEPARSDLAERIVRAALHTPQRAAVSPLEWLTVLFAELQLPRPAFVLAATLLLGFFVGLGASLELSPPADDADASALQSFLQADEDLS